MVAAQVQAAPTVPWVRIPGSTQVSTDVESATNGTLQARSGSVGKQHSHDDAPYKLVVLFD